MPDVLAAPAHESVPSDLMLSEAVDTGRWLTWFRSHFWDLAFVFVATASTLLILYLGRDHSFWADDWAMIDTREPWTFDSFVEPFNGHLFLLPTVEFKVLVSLAGIHTHLPYLAVNVLLHVVTATAIYVWLKGEAGPLIATTGSALFLVLGTAGEVFFHAAAVNFIGAAAFGAWALVVFMGGSSLRRLWVSSGLLVVAILFGGAGIVFAAAIALICLLKPERLRQLWVIAPGLTLYGAWILLYGGDVGARVPLGIGDMRIFVDYVQTGLGRAVGSLTGTADDIGLVLAVILLAATVVYMLGGRALVIGVVVGAGGLALNYIVAGLARAEFGAEQAMAPRYVYTAAVFILIAVGGWLSMMPRVGRQHPTALLAFAVVAGWAIVFNLAALRWFGRTIFADRANQTRAAVTVLSTYGGTPALPWDERPNPLSDPFLEALPSPHRLTDLITRYGSPLADTVVPAPPIPREGVERVLFQLTGSAATREMATEISPDTKGLQVLEQEGIQLVHDGACLIASSGASRGSLTVGGAAGGSSLAIKPDMPSQTRLHLSASDFFLENSYLPLDLVPSAYTVVGLPDLGPLVTWRSRIQVPIGTSIEVCARARPADG